MIDSSNIPATYAKIVPATPNRRQPRNAISICYCRIQKSKFYVLADIDAISTLYHVSGLGCDAGVQKKIRIKMKKIKEQNKNETKRKKGESEKE